MSNNNPRKLRQKAINLLYLIFLAMIFTYISSDFVDAVQKSDQTSNDLGNNVLQQSNRYNLLVLDHLRGDSINYNRTKLKISNIDRLTNIQLDKIDSIRNALIAKEGKTSTGYFKGGKREVAANKLMIYGNKAEELFRELETYKLDVSQFVEATKVDEIDSIMPLLNYQYRSDGNLVSSEKFYFYKHPLTVSILNLTGFKNKVILVRNYVINELIKDAVNVSSNPLPTQLAAVIQSTDELVSTREYLPLFLDQAKFDSVIVYDNGTYKRALEAAQKELQEKKDELSIESLNDSVYAVGKPIRYNFMFDENKGNPVNVKLTTPDGQETTYTLFKPGTFLFVPESKGYYQIRYSNGKIQGRKNVKVLDLDPVLANNTTGTLYIGINNELKLRTSEFEDTEGLQARVSNGKILKKGKSFYVRVFEEGQVRVEVFAKMPYGFVRIAFRDYVVRTLNPPTVSIPGSDLENNISKTALTKLKALEVKADELLVDEEYYIESFDMTLIYNDHTAILRPINNIGNSLNPASLKALENTRKGDIVMFTNIKAKSSLGTDVHLKPLTYTVKE